MPFPPQPARARAAGALLLLLLAAAGCAGRGEGPTLSGGAVAPPVTPPASERPRGAGRDDIVSATRAQRDSIRAVINARAAAAVAIAQGAAARAAASGVEAVSLLGDTLRRPPIDEATRRRQALLLAQARADWAADSTPEALLWIGRRLAYLGRYREAIATFSEGLERFPADPRFLRHRGHRYITTRQLQPARADLDAAARLTTGLPDALEPDGLPNARGIPTSTLQGNIWYHLGLAEYLVGGYAEALGAFDQARELATTDDMRLAVDYWRYLILRRVGRDAEARALIAWVTPELDVIENEAYRRLLLHFRGLLPREALAPAGAAALDDATVAYGLAAYDLVEGRRTEALAGMQRIVDGGNWAAFGHIAAEAELARQR